MYTMYPSYTYCIGKLLLVYNAYKLQQMVNTQKYLLKQVGGHRLTLALLPLGQVTSIQVEQHVHIIIITRPKNVSPPFAPVGVQLVD